MSINTVFTTSNLIEIYFNILYCDQMRRVNLPKLNIQLVQ